MDEKRPVVCFDELPVHLTGDVIEAQPMKEGRSACLMPPRKVLLNTQYRR